MEKAMQLDVNFMKNILCTLGSKLTEKVYYRSEKTLKLCVTGHCVRNSPVTGEFPTQKASNAENVSIW